MRRGWSGTLDPSASGGGSGAASRDAILDLCDRLLDEVGRRQHLFSWLREPGAGTDEWLAVDAYYPARRLVVLCRDADGEHDTLFDELIPAHGLGLLRVELDALGPDPEEAVSAQIEALELPPREMFDVSVGAASRARQPDGAGRRVARAGDRAAGPPTGAADPAGSGGRGRGARIS